MEIIDLKGNDTLSKLNVTDKKSILLFIKDYILTYRDSIHIPKEVTFGVEIEYEMVRKKAVQDFLKDHKDWELHEDLSLADGDEIVSPIMNDDFSFWKELKEICAFLTLSKAKTSDTCAAHVHVGNILGGDLKKWVTFIKLYSLFEEELLIFGIGDKETFRTLLDYYARPFKEDLINCLEYILFSSELSSLKLYGRNNSVNFNNAKFNNIPSNTNRNTIEFRFANGTTNEIVWQNLINLFTKMLIAVKENRIDEDLLDYYLKRSSRLFNDGKERITLNTDKSLLFSDMIFDNNEDKVYFLNQCLSHGNRFHKL